MAIYTIRYDQPMKVQVRANNEADALKAFNERDYDHEPIIDRSESINEDTVEVEFEDFETDEEREAD